MREILILFSFCHMNLEICENMHEGGRNILVEDEEKDFMRMTFSIFSYNRVKSCKVGCNRSSQWR